MAPARGVVERAAATTGLVELRWLGDRMDSSAGSIPLQSPARTEDQDQSRRLLRDLLSVLRGHLGMEVAFVSRVEAGRRTFEHVDADPWFCPITVGESDAVESTYCARVLDGRIPGLIIDARKEPGVQDLESTWAMPIGSHLSVPVHTPDGGTYGTLCCFSRDV